MKRKLLAAITLFSISFVMPVQSNAVEPISITMENYQYPYSVSYLTLNIEGQDLKMAYMDIKSKAKSNGKNVLLLHGKNFFGAYWEKTINFLSDNGYRVIVPDQIGFGKSAKPDINYSFHLLADNTNKLLEKLEINKIAVIGHSMGGMLATRFSLMYPEKVTHFILENPIGLEDYKLFVPYNSIEELYKNELKATEESIRNYHKKYYVKWNPEYNKYSDPAVGWLASGEYPRQAKSAALTYQMIYQQPVCYEFNNIKAKSLLIIGQEDRTVVGKDKVKKELLSKVGQYPALGRKTASLIPNSKLVEIENTGHIPHLESTEKFNQEILNFLEK